MKIPYRLQILTIFFLFNLSQEELISILRQHDRKQFTIRPQYADVLIYWISFVDKVPQIVSNPTNIDSPHAALSIVLFQPKVVTF
jgi:hypothetical protein